MSECFQLRLLFAEQVKSHWYDAGAAWRLQNQKCFFHIEVVDKHALTLRALCVKRKLNAMYVSPKLEWFQKVIGPSTVEYRDICNKEVFINTYDGLFRYLYV